MGIANSPGLERRYSTELANHIAAMQIGDSIFWVNGGWSRSGPDGTEFTKTEDGIIRPKRIK